MTPDAKLIEEAKANVTEVIQLCEDAQESLDWKSSEYDGLLLAHTKLMQLSGQLSSLATALALTRGERKDEEMEDDNEPITIPLDPKCTRRGCKGSVDFPDMSEVYGGQRGRCDICGRAHVAIEYPNSMRVQQVRERNRDNKGPPMTPHPERPPMENEKLIAELNGEAMYGVDKRPNYVRELLNRAATALAAATKEIEVLRRYGNKDCTAMADVALSPEKPTEDVK